MSLNIKQKTEFCYGGIGVEGCAGDPPWVSRLLVAWEFSSELGNFLLYENFW